MRIDAEALSELQCALCGVVFACRRTRRPSEPFEFATTVFSSSRTPECEAGGCTIALSKISLSEHYAGPGCATGLGYSGWKISVEEMHGSWHVQCLVQKPPPDLRAGNDKDEDSGQGRNARNERDDDREYERGTSCFLTGISTEIMQLCVNHLQPVRYGRRFVRIDRAERDIPKLHEDGDDPSYPMLFHPTCFDVFERVSLHRYGTVDLEGLYMLWQTQLSSFRPLDIEFQACRKHRWHHVVGTEFLAANPIHIPGFSASLDGALQRVEQTLGQAQSQTPNEEASRRSAASMRNSHDHFYKLPPEILEMFMFQLSAQDLANLRLVSRRFHELPDSVCKHLIRRDWPWFWEMHDTKAMEGHSLNWHHLYLAAQILAQTRLGLKNRKRIWRIVGNIVEAVREWESMPR